MRNRWMRRIGIVLLAIGVVSSPSPASGTAYPSLAGVEGLKAVFDVRTSSPKKTALFLRLIHETYRHEDLEGLPRVPEFVVVFNGESVTLVAEDYERFPRRDRGHLEEIAATVKAMAAEGIAIEGCLTAAEIFVVDPERFHKEILKVNNAWISISAYQSREYSVIPVY